MFNLDTGMQVENTNRFSQFSRVGQSPSETLRRLCFYTCLSVHTGGGRLPQCMLGYHPPREDLPEADPPKTRPSPGADAPPSGERWPLLRTVRILLECILVARMQLIGKACKGTDA